MIAALALLASALPTAATPIVRCGAVPRPGIAERGADGSWHGRAVEACRAAAGSSGNFTFRGYDAATLAQARQDDIAFLSDSERSHAQIVGSGPILGVSEQMLVVEQSAHIRDPSALAHGMVCFMIGSSAEDALEDWVQANGVPIRRIGFQERDEMHDAFAVGRCSAMAIDSAEMPSDARPVGKPLAQTTIRAIALNHSGAR